MFLNINGMNIDGHQIYFKNAEINTISHAIFGLGSSCVTIRQDAAIADTIMQI